MTHTYQIGTINMKMHFIIDDSPIFDGAHRLLCVTQTVSHTKFIHCLRRKQFARL